MRRWILIEGRDRGAYLDGNSWRREDVEVKLPWSRRAEPTCS